MWGQGCFRRSLHLYNPEQNSPTLSRCITNGPDQGAYLLVCDPVPTSALCS